MQTQAESLEEDFHRACSVHRHCGDFDVDGRVMAGWAAVEACDGLIDIYIEDFDQLKKLSRWLNNRDSQRSQLSYDMGVLIKSWST